MIKSQVQARKPTDLNKLHQVQGPGDSLVVFLVNTEESGEFLQEKSQDNLMKFGLMINEKTSFICNHGLIKNDFNVFILNSAVFSFLLCNNDELKTVLKLKKFKHEITDKSILICEENVWFNVRQVGSNLVIVM